MVQQYGDPLGAMESAMHIERKAEPEHTHPFSQDIMDVPLPEQFKMPQMTLYEGKTDPDDHIEIYIGYMNLYEVPKAIQCRAFRTTLAGVARRWFKRLPTNSISCWNDLKKAF